MKQSLKTILKLLCILLAAVLAGLVLMAAVYCLPLEPIKANVRESVEIFEAESNYPKLIARHYNTTLDNWTDAYILSEAGYDGGESPIIDAMLNPHTEVVNENPAEGLVKIYGGDTGLELTDVNYGRYWHGYLTLIKPLLLLINYGQLRELMGLVQLLLFVSVVVLLTLKKKALYALSVTLVYAFLNPAALSMSITYNTVYMLIFIQMLVIIAKSDVYSVRANWIVHFMIAGCLTSFMDYLTYPLAAFGVPMLLLLALYPDSPGRDFMAVLRSGLAWVFGYVGMWASKLIVGGLISGQNILKDANDMISFRSGGAVEEGYSHLELMFRAIYKNLSAGKLVLGLAALGLLAGIVYALIKKARLPWGRVLLLGAFMAAPLAWYAFAANHSYVHYFFTYRTLSISVFAAALLCLELVGRGAAEKSVLSAAKYE